MQYSLLVLALSTSVFVTVAFLVLGMFWKGEDPVRTRVENLRAGLAQAGPDLSLPLTERVVTPLLDGLADKVLAILPSGLLGTLKKKLILAGSPVDPSGYIVATATAMGVFVLLATTLIVAMGAEFQVKQLLVVVTLAAVGALLPYLWLGGRIRARQATIMKSLPDSFDLITTCVEAGLGLDAALSRVAEKVEGPFAEELSHTLREIGLGRARKDALKGLGERTGVPDLITFVNAIIQGEQMGTSVGQVLRVQADQMRMRRRQRAEEQAQKAPVKMVFPLVLCIFPTLFLVILGPGAITIYETFVA
jgi:tight adherence protein C